MKSSRAEMPWEGTGAWAASHGVHAAQGARKTTRGTLTVFQEKSLPLGNLWSHSVHSGTSECYSQYKASYKVYPKNSSFVAGFAFPKAEQ